MEQAASPTRIAVTPGRALQRGSLLSFYFCSAYGFRSGSRVLSNVDIARVSGC